MPAAIASSPACRKPSSQIILITARIGGFRLTLLPRLLVPVRNPVFWQYCSHKLGRLAVPYLLIAMFISNALIGGSMYRFLFALQCAWYLCAIAGYVVADREIAVAPALEIKEERKAA